MKYRIPKIVLLCLLLLFFASIPVFAEDSVDTPFSCYTLDTQNHKINGYWSEKDNTWYLFMTSSQSVTRSMIYFTGDIESASNGILDKEHAVVDNAFQAAGDEVFLTSADGSVYRVAALQSSLPSVYIDLEGATLDDIHADKDKKHKGNSIYITDPAGNYDLTVEDSLEIKGRGNSTWREYEKKAYQIKFDKKTPVLGMEKAKKWVLLANASDDSMMRNQLVYEMAKDMDMDFVCELEYVDLWIEGEYRGTFLLGEKVEPGAGRLELTNDAGVLIEHDEAFYMEEDYWFYNEALARHFVLKEIVEEDETIIQNAMQDFNKAVDKLMQYLYYTPSSHVTLEKLSAMIDVDSFAKYYLVNEYVLNKESYATSFYWYKDGPADVIHLGPLWDFDTCMGNDGSGYTENYGYKHTIFRYLLAVPEFHQRVEDLREEYRDVLAEMVEHAGLVKAQIEDSAKMNYIRWDVLGKPNPKGGLDFYPTFDEAVAGVQAWLENRDGAFEVSQSVIDFSKRTVQMFRLYNPNSGEHFYTGSAEERDTLMEAGWNYEGVGWNAPMADGLPIYRVYNPNAGDHHYTGSMEEVNNLVAVGWNYEGVAWNTPIVGMPVYRLYNPNAFSGAHHYTPSTIERDHLISLGWKYEGIAWNGAV